ncbi:MAG: hypothetical protein ACN6O3_17560 [Comamonas sp.]
MLTELGLFLAGQFRLAAILFGLFTAVAILASILMGKQSNDGTR